MTEPLPDVGFIETREEAVDGLMVRVHTVGDRNDQPVLWLSSGGACSRTTAGWRRRSVRAGP